jgi:predicted esterase
MEAKFDHPDKGKTWYKDTLQITDIGVYPLDTDLINQTLDDVAANILQYNADILIGFSQGGNVVDTFLVNRPNQIKCAIIFSGYSFVDESRIIVSTPVMNVCATNDDIVLPTYMPKYTNSITVLHDKGHKIPTSKPILRQIVEFIHQHYLV